MKSLLIVSTMLALTGTAMAAELDDVLSCNYETLGGLDSIRDIKSARMTGTMTMGPMQAPFKIEFLPPDRVRLEFELQGMTAVQAYDGETGWAIMPFLGKTEPEEMAEDQLKSVKEMAEWEGPLVDWQKKGHTVELIGTEEVEGTEAYALKVVRAGTEDESTYYLDTDYCLPFLTKGVREVQGNEMAFTQSIGDYKPVGDIVIAHSMSSSVGEGSAPAQQVISIESATFNVDDISADDFKMPKATAASDAE